MNTNFSTSLASDNAQSQTAFISFIIIVIIILIALVVIGRRQIKEELDIPIEEWNWRNEVERTGEYAASPGH